MIFIELLKVILLGIVEGITEWLPISSTGHMILVDEFIKLNVSEAFMEFFLVVIQLGAILAVVVLYWNKLWPFYIRKIPKKTQMALRKQSAVPRTVLTFVEKYCDKDKWILWFKILVACLPTIIIALPFNDIIEEKFYNYVVVAIMLIVYGVLFIVIENYNKRRRPTCTRLDELSFKTALIIGCFQVLSVIPGTSRSGSTIIPYGCSRIYLFPGNSGYVRSKSSETGEIRFCLQLHRADHPDRRCCGILCGIYSCHQIPDGIYQETRF